MKQLRHILAMSALLAGSAFALGNPPQIAVLSKEGSAVDVHKVSEINRINFAEGVVTVVKPAGQNADYQPSKIHKIIFDNEGLYSSVDNVAVDDAAKLTVTPNPVADSFSLNTGTPTPLSVFTITGSRVIYIPEYKGGQIDATHLAPGIYIVKTSQSTAKFIKL